MAFTPLISFMSGFCRKALDPVGEALNVEVDQQRLPTALSATGGTRVKHKSESGSPNGSIANGPAGGGR